MRTFIAIDMPNDIKLAVAGYVGILRKTIPDVKWVTPENTHLTLKFLGEVPDNSIDLITECSARAAAGFCPFTVELAHMGFFPNSRQPRVIWIGVNSGVDHLLELYQDMEDCFEGIGIDREEKTFSPHLTIGRVKKHAYINIPAGIPEFEEVAFEVHGVSVVKSILTPQGPIYETLSEAAFSQLSMHEQ